MSEQTVLTIMSLPQDDPKITDYSINKVYAFREAQYDRIIHIDSDVDLFLHLDELFFLPPGQLAMPRAYWEGAHSGILSPKLMVLQPSYREYKLLMEVSQGVMHGQVTTNVSRGYDMDLLNQRFGSSAIVLPHRQYGLTTGEFRTKDHRTFLGNDYEKWDPDRTLAEARLIHFTDSPLPKPWIMWPHGLMTEMLPKCDVKPGTYEESGCRDREVWKKIYDNYRQKRKVSVIFFCIHFFRMPNSRN
jgi:alpha-N-acetylglucosamine transferase